MKITLLVSLIAYHLSLITASAAVPLKWTVETSAANPATFDEFAGATYDLEAALQSHGKPLAVEGDAHLYWQTNGMGSAWWTAPATVSGNVLRATWTPACDVGARVYNCFLGITGTVYNAAFQLRLRPSPGALPNALPLPTPVIDFSRVTVLNPPWSGGGSGGTNTNDVKAIVDSEVGGTNAVKDAVASVGSKRDKTDMTIKEPTNVHWVWTSSDPKCPEGWLDIANSYGAPKPVAREELVPGELWGWWITGNIGGFGQATVTTGGKYETSVTINFGPDASTWLFYATATRQSATNTTPVKVDEIALVSQLPSADELLTAEQRTEIAKVKDKADEFGEWECSDGVERTIYEMKRSSGKYVYSTDANWKENLPPTPDSWYSQQYDNRMGDITLSFYYGEYQPQDPITATRKRVLRTGEAATQQELTNAISTNNPAFVSAVRDTPPDNDTPWGEYGTVGAAIAGLVALVALLAKRSAFAPEYSATSAYAAGDYVWHDGNIYQCKTAIASPGEAWTAAHWDGPHKLDDFFSESNSLLTATIAAKDVPEYSSTLTYEVDEIVLHDGAAYKCTTAITTAEAWTASHWTSATDADVAARLKGLKADGSATNAFASDLLSKQVAKEAIVKECLYDEYTVPTTGDDAYNLHANASNLLVFNSSQTSYTFDLSAHLPQKVNGKLMDFFIELNTDAPVTVSTNAADTAKIRGDSPSVSEAGNYWITFSTKADGTIYIRNIKMEAPQS